MNTPILLQDLIAIPAARKPDVTALSDGAHSLSYGKLQEQLNLYANGLLRLGLKRNERVAIYLEKRFETVIACFGSTAASGVFVPVNPLLKPAQVEHILRDCNVRMLVTSRERHALLAPVLGSCSDLRQVIIVSDTSDPLPASPSQQVCRWSELLDMGKAATRPAPSAIDSDMAAILYTSGSTGKPKGVVISHRNFVAGAVSVAGYLENGPEDVLLAALPLSFDAGFSQLTTAFHAGARVVLLNYLLPRDVLKAMQRDKVTGITAVPPLYIQLAQLDWPADIDRHLRYFANTGGRMPRETLTALRARVPHSKPYLMYGLTEAFRSTYLPPEEVDRRPDSIGRAIPNAEILVLHDDGTPCAANEPGELVHRGPLVSLGYWNDCEKTAERFKPLPAGLSIHPDGLVLPEIAVFSGDTVRTDEEGFLYFIGRRDEMIKTSGYRVSPTEVEEIIYATGMVGECVAFGISDAALGQAIQVIVSPASGASIDPTALLAECRARMPAYMVPARIDIREGPLPRNANGKIDRALLGTP